MHTFRMNREKIIIFLGKVCTILGKTHTFHSLKRGKRLSQRNGEGLFDLADDEDAVEGADTVEVAEGAEDEFLVVVHGAGVYLEHIVIVSGGVETFDDLVDFGDHRSELAGEFLAVLLEAHVAEYHYAVSDLYRIDYSDIFPDIAFALETFLAFEDRGRGKVHLGGELLGRQFGVLLQFAEDEDVGFVQNFLIHTVKIFIMSFRT